MVTYGFLFPANSSIYSASSPCPFLYALTVTLVLLCTSPFTVFLLVFLSVLIQHFLNFFLFYLLLLWCWASIISFIAHSSITNPIVLIIFISIPLFYITSLVSEYKRSCHTLLSTTSTRWLMFLNGEQVLGYGTIVKLPPVDQLMVASVTHSKVQ